MEIEYKFSEKESLRLITGWVLSGTCMKPGKKHHV